MNEWKGLNKKRGKLFPSKYYREWRNNIFNQITMPAAQRKLIKFRDKFDRTLHALTCTIIHHIPEDILFTKKGEISLRSKDLTNIEKPLLDIFCDKRFCGRTDSNGNEIQNLSLDDCGFIDVLSKKRLGKEFTIELKFAIVDINKAKEK